MVGLWYRRKLRGTRQASNGGRVRVRIIHGLNISHKELTYLLQKSISHRNKVLRACSQGDRLVGKDHRSSPTATHKEDNQRTPHVSNLLHNGSPYVHATGLANLNTSISQFHNYSTSTPLISPPLYLKTIYQASTFSQHLEFITKVNYDAVLKDSQNDISEA